MADPVRAFRDASTAERMFWLDGGGARPWSGRRSIIGVLAPEDVSITYDARRRVVLRHHAGRTEQVGTDVFEVLSAAVADEEGDPDISWVGYLGYAARPDLPAQHETDAAVPDAVWMRVRDPLVIEHDETAQGDRTAPSHRAGQATPHPVPAAYAAAFDEVQRQLRAGNSYEVNLTYRESVGSPVDPVSAYLDLRAANPAPYAGFLRHRDVYVLSSSPERYATIDRNRWLEAKPIKGTTPRGGDPESDRALRVRLSSDPRFRAENLMIVDLMRNDLSMVCRPGTVSVPSLMEVESYASVHQLVSTVRGRLRDDVTTVEALRALFPAGSMTGAPKRRTMEIIRDVEGSPRGVYAGAFGWISGDGRADLGVVIRTLVATAEGGQWRYYYGTGGGITVRSDVESEYAETRWKAERLRQAVT